MIIRTSLDLPAVVRKSLEAYSAGDPVTLSEGFDQHAQCLVQFDPKLGKRIGLKQPSKPVLADGAIGIMDFYASEFAAFEVTYLDVLSAMRAGRDVAAVCEWGVRLRGSGLIVAGRCHNIWTLDSQGRKIIEGRSVCKIITPEWDKPIN